MGCDVTIFLLRSKLYANLTRLHMLSQYSEISSGWLWYRRMSLSSFGKPLRHTACMMRKAKLLDGDTVQSWLHTELWVFWSGCLFVLVGTSVLLICTMSSIEAYRPIRHVIHLSAWSKIHKFSFLQDGLQTYCLLCAPLVSLAARNSQAISRSIRLAMLFTPATHWQSFRLLSKKVLRLEQR